LSYGALLVQKPQGNHPSAQDSAAPDPGIHHCLRRGSDAEARCCTYHGASSYHGDKGADAFFRYSNGAPEGYGTTVS